MKYDRSTVLKDPNLDLYNPAHETAIKTAYIEEVNSGALGHIELDYTAAKSFLSGHLTQKQHQVLGQIEQAYQENWRYAREYPFYCGLLCAFEQFMLPERTPQFSYETAVVEGLETIPQMMQHQEYYRRNNAIIRDTAVLEQNADKRISRHLTSICCAWDQRIHSAAHTAFDMGYQAGLNAINHAGHKTI